MLRLLDLASHHLKTLALPPLLDLEGAAFGDATWLLAGHSKVQSAGCVAKKRTGSHRWHSSPAPGHDRRTHAGPGRRSENSHWPVLVFFPRWRLVKFKKALVSGVVSLWTDLFSADGFGLLF